MQNFLQKMVFWRKKREDLPDEKIAAILQSLLPLCEKENEYGGWINRATGEIVELVEGEKKTVPLVPSDREYRAKGEQGLSSFHTHRRQYPEGSWGNYLHPTQPSNGDYLHALAINAPAWVITLREIYVIKPSKRVSLREIDQWGKKIKKVQQELQRDDALPDGFPVETAGFPTRYTPLPPSDCDEVPDQEGAEEAQ